MQNGNPIALRFVGILILTFFSLFTIAPVLVADGLPEESSNVSSHTIIIDGSVYPEASTGYRFKVTGTVERVDGMLEGLEVTTDDGEVIEGKVVNGSVGDRRDGYRFTGEIVSVRLDNPAGAEILIDGEMVAGTPDSLPETDSYGTEPSEYPDNDEADPYFLQEGFDGDFLNWVMIDVEGSVEGGSAKIEFFEAEDGPAGSMFTQSPVPMEDIAIAFNARFTTAGLTFGLMDPSGTRTYAVGLGYGNRDQVVLLAGDTSNVVAQEQMEAWKPGEWHYYELVRSGDWLEVFRDGEEIIWAEYDGDLGEGYVFFIPEKPTTIYMDNLEVYSL